MRNNLKYSMLAAAACAALTACGGGSSGPSSDAVIADGPTMEPARGGTATKKTSVRRTPAAPTAAIGEPAAFTATVTTAPDDGAHLCNNGYTVAVAGNAMQRVEMTSNDGILIVGDTYPPKTVNQLTVAPDGASAQLAFNVRNGNFSGQRDVAVTAYSATGESIVVFTRSWTFDQWAWRDNPQVCTG